MEREREGTRPRRRNRGPAAAADNRRALIDAARAVFAEQGLDAPLSRIARRAGVGQGSLYRHFPDRVGLAVAVFEDNLTALETLADPPGAGVDGLLETIAEQAISSAGLVELVAGVDDERTRHLGARVARVAASVLASSRARGEIAAHVTDGDVLIAISMLALGIARTEADAKPAFAVRARAMLAIWFDAPEPEPGDGQPGS